MPTLHEIQRSFGAALEREDGAAAFASHVISNGIDAVARIRIYRNNSREIHLGTLRTAFPVIERLVGEDYFRQLGLEYGASFPSRSGNLYHLGERFPQFLEQRFAATRYRYLADVAQLEWAHEEILVAADHASLDIERLRQVAAEDYPRLRFRLHPAARLLTSAFPVLAIWSANQPGADPDQVIDLDRGGENVLLLRTAHGTELRLLAPAEFVFLRHIRDGASLEEAAGRAGAADDFDLGSFLRRHVAAGVLVDFTLADPRR